MFESELIRYRDEILRCWLDDVIAEYPADTAGFLRAQPDRFANPVGASLREGLAELLDGMLGGVEPEELTPALDRVIRVRAVQEFSPSAAVGFVFRLKRLVREVVGTDGAGAADVLDEFDRRIEGLGMCAFDVYMRCREQMWKIRAQEIRNQSVGILERVAVWREAREEKSEEAPPP